MKLNADAIAKCEASLKEAEYMGADDHIGASNFAVKYSDIKELKLVNVGGLIPIIPTGIMVICQNPENGKTVKHKCSVMKRKEWIEYLRGKARL